MKVWDGGAKLWILFSSGKNEIFMNECGKWVKYWFWQEKIIFISTCHGVIFILAPKIRNFVTQSIWSNLVVRWLTVHTHMPIHVSQCGMSLQQPSSQGFSLTDQDGWVGIQHTSLILSIREFTQFATNWEFKHVTTYLWVLLLRKHSKMVEILVGSSWLSEHPDWRDEPETDVSWNLNIVANLHQPTPLKGYRRSWWADQTETEGQVLPWSHSQNTARDKSWTGSKGYPYRAKQAAEECKMCAEAFWLFLLGEDIERNNT